MKFFVAVNGGRVELELSREAGVLVARVAEQALRVDLSPVGDGAAYSMLVDGRSYDVTIDPGERGLVVQLGGERVEVAIEDEREHAAHQLAGAQATGRRDVRAVMPGIVVDVRVAAGDKVEEGQTLVILEAMKMQNPILSDGGGTVRAVRTGRGQAVAAGAVLIELE
jgi:biotin carboxyl carrier protein